MKLVTYDRGDDARSGLAIDNFIIDLELAARALVKAKLPPSLRELLAAGEPALESARKVAAECERMIARPDHARRRQPAWMIPDDETHFGPPIPDPEKIIAIGLNYRDHVAEQEGVLHRKMDVPKHPILFAKFPSALTGPYDPIRLPPERVSKQVDYEVELAVVIGRTLNGASQRTATEAIAGYMIMNDVSARDCQMADRQWVRAKSFNTFAPCGPWIVTPDELGSLNKRRLWTAVNGETLQDSVISNMIFKVPHIVSYISQGITLKPGDIITTGTPAGVGLFRNPHIFLHAGDTVECGIEGIGIICNTCQ